MQPLRGDDNHPVDDFKDNISAPEDFNYNACRHNL